MFVLDIRNFSTIIYIWYEGGGLKPPLVRLTFTSLFRTWTIRSGAEGATAAEGGGSEWTCQAAATDR